MTLLAVAIGLSGCSGPVETRVHSSGQGIVGLALVDMPAASGSPAARAQQLVAAELEKRAGPHMGAATHQLTVTLSERPAALGLRAGEKKTSRIISAPKKRKPLQNCDDREFRLSVILTRIADGSESYRGEASEYHCKASIDESLPHLVAAALADLRAPKGSYVVTRQGRD